MLKNKLIKSVCLLDRFNHFNIFFFISQDMKSKVFKIFFYLQHSNFFFTRTKWKCNLILTPCIFLSMIWHIWILVHFAPWPLGEKVWSEKNMFSRHGFIFFVKSISRKIGCIIQKRYLFFNQIFSSKSEHDGGSVSVWC